jgi:hypothetical protein
MEATRKANSPGAGSGTRFLFATIADTLVVKQLVGMLYATVALGQKNQDLFPE